MHMVDSLFELRMHKLIDVTKNNLSCVSNALHELDCYDSGFWSV